MSDSTFLAAQEANPDPAFQQAPGPARAPTSEVLGATVRGAVSALPGIGLYRWLRREADTIRAQGIDPSDMSVGEPDAGAEPLLTPEEANERFGGRGVTFGRPMAESAARELREIADRDAVRADILSRAQGGAAEWTARMALSLAAGVVDPLNVASAFVPVVGAARGAAWLAQAGSRMGRAGVAARIGAIEGAAGGALLAPLTAFVHAQENRDYGLLDALLDVAVGSVFGAALQGGGRALVDTLRGWHGPAGHEGAVRAAVAQVAQGEAVEIGPVLSLSRQTTRADLLGSAAALPRTADGMLDVAALRAMEPATLAEADARIALAQADIRAADAAVRGEAAEVTAQAARATTGTPEVTLTRAEVIAAFDLEGRPWAMQALGDRQDFTPAQMREAGLDADMVDAIVAGDAAARLDAARAADTPAAALRAEAQARLDDAMAARERLAADPRRRAFARDAAPFTDADARGLVRDMAAGPRTPPGDGNGIAEARLAAAQTRAGVDTAPTGEPPQVRRAAEIEAASADLDQLVAQQEAAGRLPPADRAAIDAADAAVAEAKGRASAWEAAAACLISNGA